MPLCKSKQTCDNAMEMSFAYEIIWMTDTLAILRYWKMIYETTGHFVFVHEIVSFLLWHFLNLAHTTHSQHSAQNSLNENWELKKECVAHVNDIFRYFLWMITISAFRCCCCWFFCLIHVTILRRRQTLDHSIARSHFLIVNYCI